MLARYVAAAFRRSRSDKLHTAINVVGLAIGLACFVLIGMFVRYELGYDRHTEAHLAANAGPVAPLLKEFFPEIEKSARIFCCGGVLKTPNGSAVLHTGYAMAACSTRTCYSSRAPTSATCMAALGKRINPRFRGNVCTDPVRNPSAEGGGDRKRHFAGRFFAASHFRTVLSSSFAKSTSSLASVSVASLAASYSAALRFARHTCKYATSSLESAPRISATASMVRKW